MTNFSARADAAALALKGRLSAQNQQLGRPEIKPRSVPVGPDGNPAPPLPPEGSYARQAIDRQRQLAEQQRANLQTEQPVQAAPPEAPREPVGAVTHQQQLEHENQLSPNAQRRFSELSQTLREKDRELQQALARSQKLEETHAQTEARLRAIESQYEQMVQQNLDSLDPETRHQVMQQAAIAESAAQIERRVMNTVAPFVNRMQTQAIQAELHAVAQKYPGFDASLHGPLIEIFREQNPNCTIEQAFRAVAEGDDLVPSPARAPAIPPVAVPQSVNIAPRHVQINTPPPQTSPEEEIERDRQRAFNLARSADPLERRMAGPAMDRLIQRKLGNAMPGRR